jgi:hypothetical protein
LDRLHPEWMDTATAAAYLSLTKHGFARRVNSGVIPNANYGLGERSPRWKRADLDAMMNPSLASVEDDIMASVRAFAQKSSEAKKGRTRRQASAR